MRLRRQESLSLGDCTCFTSGDALADQTTLPHHQTSYQRTVVLGDLHGDLDTALRSLAAKQLLRYDGDLELVIALLRAGATTDDHAELEAMVLSQPHRVQLVFLGDLLDRYHQGYLLIQFLQQIRWRTFGIDLVVLMGNHDLHNLQFFANPPAVFQIYKESEHMQLEVMDFIGRMGLIQSVSGFMSLHGEEIAALQQRFYREGSLSFALGQGTEVTFRYACDLAALADETVAGWDDVWQRLGYVAQALGFSFDIVPSWQESLAGFSRRLARKVLGDDFWNVWDLLPPWLASCGDQDGYDPRLRFANVVLDMDENLQPRRFLLLDWRVIAMVWRRYYGDFFRAMDVMHLEGNTLFVHGGLSPQTLVDQFGFGVMYHLSSQRYNNPEDPRRFGLMRAVNRVNRLARQVVDNALGDVGFRSTCGAEIIDGIGSRRGGRAGFTEFGGPMWADFDFLNQMTYESEQVRLLYQSFVRAGGLRRVICGHTRFDEPSRPDLRYLRLQVMADLGLDYICVDNSCSRGYRLEPVLNGIEINGDGVIADAGQTR